MNETAYIILSVGLLLVVIAEETMDIIRFVKKRKEERAKKTLSEITVEEISDAHSRVCDGRKCGDCKYNIDKHSCSHVFALEYIKEKLRRGK